MYNTSRKSRIQFLLIALVLAALFSALPMPGTPAAQARCDLKGVAIAAPGGGYWAVVVNGQGLPVAIAINEKGEFAVFDKRGKAERVANRIARHICRFGDRGENSLGETPPFMPLEEEWP